eukprot:6457523-Amphidinium_carterae.1
MKFKVFVSECWSLFILYLAQTVWGGRHLWKRNGFDVAKSAMSTPRFCNKYHQKPLTVAVASVQ